MRGEVRWSPHSAGYRRQEVATVVMQKFGRAAVAVQRHGPARTQRTQGEVRACTSSGVVRRAAMMRASVSSSDSSQRKRGRTRETRPRPVWPGHSLFSRGSSSAPDGSASRLHETGRALVTGSSGSRGLHDGCGRHLFSSGCQFLTRYENPARRNLSPADC